MQIPEHFLIFFSIIWHFPYFFKAQKMKFTDFSQFPGCVGTLYINIENVVKMNQTDGQKPIKLTHLSSGELKCLASA